MSGVVSSSQRTSVPLLRDTLAGDRQRWADIADSSSEQIGSTEVPAAPVINSKESYSRMMSVESMEDTTHASLHSRLEQAASLAEANARSGSAHTMDTQDHCSSSASIPTDAQAVWNSTASATQAATMAAPGSEATHLLRAHRSDAGGSGVTQPKRIAAGRLHRAACDRAPTMQTLDDCLEDSSSGHPSETARISQHSPPTKRRITRKRTQTDLTAQLHGKRLRDSMPPEAAPLPEASEEDWRRREDKRQAAVLTIKASLEYQELLSSRARGEPGVDVVPGTPDPIDHTTSKRAWEASVMQWRNALKEWGAGRAQLPS